MQYILFQQRIKLRPNRTNDYPLKWSPLWVNPTVFPCESNSSYLLSPSTLILPNNAFGMKNRIEVELNSLTEIDFYMKHGKTMWCPSSFFLLSSILILFKMDIPVLKMNFQSQSSMGKGDWKRVHDTRKQVVRCEAIIRKVLAIHNCLKELQPFESNRKYSMDYKWIDTIAPSNPIPFLNEQKPLPFHVGVLCFLKSKQDEEKQTQNQICKNINYWNKTQNLK